MFDGQTIALLVGAPVLMFFVSAWLFRLDTEVEDRRRQVAQFGQVLTQMGLKHPFGDMCVDYSVGDYSGLLTRVGALLKMAGGSPEQAAKEVDRIAYEWLRAKTASPGGAAELSRRLSEFSGVKHVVEAANATASASGSGASVATS
jgi:hypothetical protein